MSHGSITYRIELPAVSERPPPTFGIVARNHIVTDAPPIANWAIGKNVHDVIHWLRTRRGATITLLPDIQDSGHNPPELPPRPES